MESLSEEVTENISRIEDKEHLKWLHRELTHQIDEEFVLLSSRSTLLVTGSAFLFTSTAVAFTAVASENSFINHKALLNIFVFGMALLGVLMCVFSHLSMDMARLSIQEMKLKREAIENRILELNNTRILERVTRPFDKKIHRVGNIMYRYLPFAIGVMWGTLLVSLGFNMQ